jgi:molybdopterin synthase catalytic subunit
MKSRCSRRCKADEGIYDLRFAIYDFILIRVHLCASVVSKTSNKVKQHLTITRDPIDEATLVGQRALSHGMGAAVYFTGVVRGSEEGQSITAIDYEAFQTMAEHQFGLIFREMEKRWPIESVRLVHRLGVVKVNEPSLWVEVIAPHRGEAFAACQYLIDEMKRVVPIWKKPVERPKVEGRRSED